jgi:hypothetical protein
MLCEREELGCPVCPNHSWNEGFRARVRTRQEKPQVPPLRFAPVGMTIPWRGQGSLAEALAGTPKLSSRPERSVVEGPAVSLAHKCGPCTGTRIGTPSPPQSPGAPYLPGFGRCGIPQVSPSSPSRADRSVRVPHVRNSVPRISCYALLATTRMRLSLKESRMKLRKATNLDRKSGIRGPKTMGEAQPEPFVAGPPVCSLGPERNEELPFFSPGTHTHTVRKHLRRRAALAAEGAASCRD